MKKVKIWSVVIGGLILATGCGGGGERVSPQDIKNSLSQPSGVVSEENAPAIIEEALTLYNTGELLTVTTEESGMPMLAPQQFGYNYWCDPDSGVCCEASSSGISCDCPDGGDFSVKMGDCTTVSDPTSAEAMSMDYEMKGCSADNCVGDGSGFVEVGWDPSYGICDYYNYPYQQFQENPAKYFLAGFSGSVICPNDSFEGTFAIYWDFTSDEIWYMVEVNGETYWVNITYYSSEGTWTAKVRGANGTVTCQMNGDTVVSCSM